MMNFETFKTTVVELIAEYLPEEYAGAEIFTEHVVKINDDYTGLIVKKVGSNIAPTINLDETYSMYNDSTDWTFDDVLRNISDCIIKGYENAGEFGDNLSLSFENVKDKIICSLVSYKTGEKLFSDRPYIVIGNDIVVLFKIYMGAIANSEAIGTIPITNKVSESWGMSAAELYELALKNTPHIKPVSMYSMFEAMKSMALDGLADEITPEMFNDGPEQYIVSTPTKINGAVALLFNDELRKISEKLNDNFYIIPSSIHELIVMPYSKTPASVGEMNAMVRAVNEEVDEADILTDHVFVYRKDKNMLISC